MERPRPVTAERAPQQLQHRVEVRAVAVEPFFKAGRWCWRPCRSSRADSASTGSASPPAPAPAIPGWRSPSCKPPGRPRSPG